MESKQSNPLSEKQETANAEFWGKNKLLEELNGSSSIHGGKELVNILSSIELVNIYFNNRT